MSKKSYEVGGRNVFQDIGVPNADEHLLKAQLVYQIDALMKKRRMKQREAAALFGVHEPDISNMLRGEFRQFSLERLLRFLAKLDQDVERIGAGQLGVEAVAGGHRLPLVGHLVGQSIARLQVGVNAGEPANHQ